MPPVVRHSFTLVEVVVVTAMILCVVALAAGRFTSFPTAAGLEKTVREIESLFAETAHAAALRGMPAAMVYDPEDRSFRMMSEEPADANAAYLGQRYRTVSLHPEMTVEFPDQKDAAADEPRSFYAYPDGTASGPAMTLKLHERRIRLKLSSLTGNWLRLDNRGAAR